MDLDYKQVRQVQFDILLEVERQAACLGVQYFLDFGTLLGARRHKGFIPWDDDIDIAMSPKSLEFFRDNVKALLPRHLRVAPHPVFPPAIKLEDRRYFVQERSNLSRSGTAVSHPGIDVFPFGFYKRVSRFLPTKTVGRIAQKRPTAKARAQLLLAGRSINAIPFWAIASIPPVALRAYANLIEGGSGMNWAGGNSTELLGHALAMGTGAKNLPYSTVFPLREIEFEGRQFLAPNDSDAYLTLLHGDWRQPVEFPRHLLKAWTA